MGRQIAYDRYCAAKVKIQEYKETKEENLHPYHYIGGDVDRIHGITVDFSTYGEMPLSAMYELFATFRDYNERQIKKLRDKIFHDLEILQQRLGKYGVKKEEIEKHGWVYVLLGSIDNEVEKITEEAHK